VVKNAVLPQKSAAMRYEHRTLKDSIVSHTLKIEEYDRETQKRVAALLSRVQNT